MNSAQEKSIHVPVMKSEVVTMLQAAKGGDFLDCTLGGGGHSEAILEASNANSVVALDRDPSAIERAKGNFAKYGDRFKGIHESFGNVTGAVEGKNFEGMLVDLGLSTDQLKTERGFSFKDSGPLDMRMDSSQYLSAQQVVNEYGFKELFIALKRGGVGNEAKAVAQAIVSARPINDTATLSRVVEGASRGRSNKTGIHPATVTFQAIRMEVNREIDEIAKMLESAPKVVKKGGRLAVITFHSIEDRLITRTMREWEQGDTTPAKISTVNVSKQGTLLTKKPIVPSDSEVRANPASRSARLRVFEFRG